MPAPRTAHDSQVVILAGGLGSRMQPRTEALPKFLLPVAGRPFGERLLERLAAAGFDHALLCIGHMGPLVRQHIGDGTAFGLQVDYSDEGDGKLGTAGALHHALGALRSTFLVTYGDSFLPFDYMAPLTDLCAHPEALGTMAVYRNDNRFDASNTAVSGDLVVRYEKRRVPDNRATDLNHIDYGAIALRRSVVEALPPGPRGLDEIQHRLAGERKLRALAAPDRFYEIGSVQGLFDLEAALALDADLGNPHSYRRGHKAPP
jgi:N-acetyl-alpha-D-muramate 1-phosphate uridylyltransferase